MSTRTQAIRYLSGDATRPIGEGPKVIAHVCNDLGRWGKGFVVAISKRWPEPRRAFVAWHAAKSAGEPPFALGRTQFVPVEASVWVANIVGQHRLKSKQGVPPVRYAAIREGLAATAEFAKAQKASVHLPRIGCGLSGGTWDRIEPLLIETLVKEGIETFVYDWSDRQ